MSTELYLICRKAGRAIHVGTRYSCGTRLLTIGPPKTTVEKWLDNHCDCDLTLETEHEVHGVDDITEDE